MYLINAMHLWKRNVVCSIAQSCLTLFDPMDCSLPGSSVHGGFSRQEHWSGCHALLLGIFPTQGLNPGLLHCRQILYLWATREAQENKWVVYPFSRGTWFFTSWAIQEAWEEKEYISVIWKYLSSKKGGIWIRPPKCIKCGQVKKSISPDKILLSNVI